MDIRQRLGRAAWVDSRQHMHALAVRDRHDLLQQVARAKPAADPVAIDLRLVERDDATTTDAERGGGEPLRVGYQRLGLDARLVAFTQVDQQDPIGSLPPGSFLLGHARSPGRDRPVSGLARVGADSGPKGVDDSAGCLRRQ
jgi:hypothetical protein